LVRDIDEVARELEARQDVQVVRSGGGSLVFRLMYVSPRGSRTLTVTARVLEGWDHLSVACSAGLPSWRQLEAARRLVANPDEWMMQLHVPPIHSNVGSDSALHLWRPHADNIPLPPASHLA
jgi:hypothetical protein